MNDWISVEDRPPDCRNILMSYNDLVMEGEFVDGKFYIPSGNACAHVEGYCTCWPQEGITHWMPLPEPPKARTIGPDERIPNADDWVQNECSWCFLQWQSSEKQDMCDDCKNASSLAKQSVVYRLHRMMKSMKTAKISRYPDVLNLMFEWIKTHLISQPYISSIPSEAYKRK